MLCTRGPSTLMSNITTLKRPWRDQDRICALFGKYRLFLHQGPPSRSARCLLQTAWFVSLVQPKVRGGVLEWQLPFQQAFNLFGCQLLDFWTFLLWLFMAGNCCQFMTLCVRLTAVKLGPPGTPDRPRSAQIRRIAQCRVQPLHSVFTLLFLLLYCSQ